MSDNKSLCLELLQADSEEDVIGILKREGYWDDPRAWRLYGERDGNYAIIGNQQSRPDAALVEKIVNSIDARLMNECQKRGISPVSSEAPSSIRHAVWDYFEDHGEKPFDAETGGTIREWSKKRRTDEAKNITVAATGTRSNPCLTIADCGEGQTPNRMPETFLSLTKSNKLRIPFVQGQFNMGGTGVLKFCGRSGGNSLQLLVTKRCPAIVSAMQEQDPSQNEWGFTIVRRERPTLATGAVKNSVFTYLAPVKTDGSDYQGVLRFKADSLPLMPEYNQAYSRNIYYGSAIKLYEYDMKGFRSHVVMKDSLLYRLEALLPDVALPVSIHECRDYEGDKKRSFVTTLSGLTVRLEQGKGGNIEEGFPDTVPFVVDGQKMVAKIYAFAKGKADTYRTNEGIILTINGQTHGAIPKNIFGRKKVKLGRLADSLLVTVDCSNISVDAREDLFMTSRDRLSNGSLRKALESELEDILRHHEALKLLRNKRRGEEVAKRLEDSKPLEDILKEVMKMSPTLAKLFQSGQRLSRPFKSSSSAGVHAGSENSGSNGGNTTENSNGVSGPFEGKQHPSYFRFPGKPDNFTLERACELGRRCRIKFETDVENGYFDRPSLKGHYEVEIVDGPLEGHALNNNLTLHDGVANWSLEVPEEACVNDLVAVQCTVNDETLLEPIVNVARLTVISKSNDSGTSSGTRDRTGSRSSSNGKQGGGSGRGSFGAGRGSEPDGISMPEIDEVEEDRWNLFEFDQNSACKVVEDSGDDDQSFYTFHVNIDNVCLLTEMKYTKENPAVLRARFVFGNVLVGLALLQDHIRNSKAQSDWPEDWSIERHIAQTTRAIAPFILPMINFLGSLESEDVIAGAESGDDE